ncbi:hypothetical protein Nmel_013594 [Mimus melanotis]
MSAQGDAPGGCSVAGGMAGRSRESLHGRTQIPGNSPQQGEDLEGSLHRQGQIPGEPARPGQVPGEPPRPGADSRAPPRLGIDPGMEAGRPQGSLHGWGGDQAWPRSEGQAAPGVPRPPRVLPREEPPAPPPRFPPNPDITITDNVLHFRAQGHGAKGDNIYEFEIEFLEPVEPKPVCRMTQRQLNITVQKKESNWWERLTKQEKRPLFLAPDFDRWLDESDAEMELKEKEEEKISKMKIESRVPKDHSFYDTFHTISDMMYFCQTLALMEIMNSLIGLVRSPLIPSVVQVFGRNFVLFVILGSLEEMQSKPVVFFIFYFWSITELFRYPYYMLSCIGIEWKPLTWLRYTVWIPLYPLGGLAEAVCIVQSIPIFSETGKFSLGLPNPLNVTIQFPFVLQIYLIALFLGVFVNFRHLYKQRKQHLGPKKRKMK